MKQLIVTVLMVLAFSCVDSGVDSSHSTVTPGEEVTLSYGQYVLIEGTSLAIRFSDVGSDSRCPVDVECIWTGNADVWLEVSGLDSPAQVIVNTNVEPLSVVVAGYEIILKKLDPYPVSTVQIEKNDYIATLQVSTAG